jgi:uncharacterized protein (TIGR02246 family)
MTKAGEKVSRVVLYGCIVLLLLASSCNQAPPDTRAADEATIRELDAQWSKAAEARDLEAVVSYYSDDAALLPPNEAVATGRQAIRAVWAPLLAPDSLVSWEAAKVDVARSGDLAYSRGTYQLEMKDAEGKPLKDRGKFLEVWKKQEDGKWKAVADMFSSDLPPAPDSAPVKK